MDTACRGFAHSDLPGSFAGRNYSFCPYHDFQFYYLACGDRCQQEGSRLAFKCRYNILRKPCKSAECVEMGSIYLCCCSVGITGNTAVLPDDLHWTQELRNKIKDKSKKIKGKGTNVNTFVFPLLSFIFLLPSLDLQPAGVLLYRPQRDPYCECGYAKADPHWRKAYLP